MQIENMASIDETNFNMLLLQLARNTSYEQFISMKQFLKGHITKEKLDGISNAQDLLCEMQIRKLVNPKKLMFLKNMLTTAKNSKKLLEFIDVYQETKQKFVRKDSMKEKINLKIEGLQTMAMRQMETIEESEQAIQQNMIEYQTHEQNKTNMQQKRIEIKENITEMKNERSNVLKQCLKYLEHCKKKQQQINDIKKDLERIIANEKSNKEEIERIDKELNQTGKSRLNAFERTLKKEEKNKKEEQLKELNDERCFAKQIIIDNNIDLKILTNKKVEMASKIIKLDKQIKKLFETLFEISKNLEVTEKLIYMTKNKINHHKLDKEKVDKVLSNIQEKMKLARKNSNTTKKISDVVDNSLSLHNAEDFDYELMRSRCTTVGYEGSSSTKLQFKFPKSLAINSRNEIWVHDSGNKRIVLCNIKGELLTSIPVGKIFVPIDITVNNKNNLIVASNTLIRIYDDNNNLSKQFLPQYEAKKQKLPTICSIDYHRNRNVIMLLDKSNLCVQLFDNDGNFDSIYYIDKHTSSPAKIHSYINNSFLVTDDYEHSAKYFYLNERGVLQCNTYGGYGCGITEFAKPIGICYDIKDNIIVVDNQNCRVKIIDADGQIIVVTGYIGHEIGLFEYPYDVASTSNGMIIISDTGNHRLTIYF